jgi:hypothetical protein
MTTETQIQSMYHNARERVWCKYSIQGNTVDLEGFEPSTSSVRLKREGLSASSAAYFRGFYPL